TYFIHKQRDGRMTARVMGFVAIFTAVGIRDESLNQSLGKAMMAGPAQWAAVKRLRRDAHEASPSCWLHGATFCLSTDDGSAGCRGMGSHSGHRLGLGRYGRTRARLAAAAADGSSRARGRAVRAVARRAQARGRSAGVDR